MPNSIPLFSTDPNVQSQAQLIQQRQALANALMSQGLQPDDPSKFQVGGVAYHQSPVEGLSKMMQAIMGAKMLRDTTQQQGALASQQYANLLMQNQPEVKPSYSDAQLSDASAQSLSGGGGPTNANAQKMADLLVKQDPVNKGSPYNPRNPMNMPAELLTDYQAGFIPKEIFETQAARYKPTDATLAAVQGGMDPVQANRQAFQKTVTDPEILKLQQAGFNAQQINAYMQAKNRKDTYVAPVDVKPGTPLVDPFDGHLLAYAPKTADGMTLNFTRDANGALVPAGASAIPGYAGGNAQIAGAEQGARQSNTITTVTDASGRQVPVWGGAAAAAGGAQTGIGGGPAVPPAPPVMRPGMPAPAVSGVGMPNPGMPTSPTVQRPMPQLGQSTSDRITQESAAKDVAALPSIVMQSKQTIAGLENAQRVINTLQRSGPGVAKSVDAVAVLNNMGIPLMQDDVDGYKTLKKFLENAASTAAASNGFTGSDARFEQFKAGQPNAETMTPQALQSAIRYVLSQHDAAVARANFMMRDLQANQGDPNAALNAQQKWSQVYNPKVFEFSRMTPPERAQFKSSLPPDQRAQFGQQYNFAHNQGWVQ